MPSVDIAPYKDSVLVKEFSHDDDLCHVSQIKYLAPRHVRNDNGKGGIKHLGMAAFRFLMEFPEYVPILNEKIVFTGIYIRDAKDSPMLYHPAIIVELDRDKKKVARKSYLLEASKQTSHFYAATL